MLRNLFKKIFLSLILVATFFFFVAGNNNENSEINVVKEVEAANYNTVNGNIYFLRPSNWTGSKVLFMVGHSSWSQGYEMTKISNTNLYYYKASNLWGDATQVAFFDTTSVWGGEGNSLRNRKGYANNSTSIVNLSSYGLTNSSGCYLYTSSFQYQGSYSGYNYTFKVEASSGGSASATGYKLNSVNTATNSSNTGASISIAYGNTATLTATPDVAQPLNV